MTRRQPPLIARIMNWACGYQPWDIDEWNEDRREQERQRLDNEEQELRIELLRRQVESAADRSVHGELIPDCPTEGVAARQGNGG
jgi:hypothetical protein